MIWERLKVGDWYGAAFRLRCAVFGHPTLAYAVYRGGTRVAGPFGRDWHARAVARWYGPSHFVAVAPKGDET